MDEPLPFLPYRCETLNGEFLQSPCAKNLARLKAVRKKFPGAFLGPLEHCAACKSNNLIIRITPPELRPAPEAAVSLPAQKDEDMAGAVKFKDEAEANRVLGAGKIPPGEENDLNASCDALNDFYGAEVQASGRATGRRLTPAEVKRGREAVSRLAATHRRTVADKVLGMVAPAPPLYPDLACKNHPDRPARIDRLGRTMRFCQECLEARGRKTGSQNFANHQPPFSIPLNAPEFAEVKEWLVAEAAEYERTLTREIMYRLKLAMRAAAVLG